MVRRVLSSALFVMISTWNTAAFAECTSLVKGPVSIDVFACGMVAPEKFDLKKPAFQFIADLDPEGREQVMSQYRGLLLKGTVVFSEAIQDGLSREKGVLQGEKSHFFSVPKDLACPALNKKRITAMLQERCCDGSAQVPCLLGNGYVLSDLKVTGDALIGEDGKSTGVEKVTKDLGPAYKEAESLFAKKKYKEAITAYKKAESAGELDVKGLYHLGYSYRETENCKSAITPLTKIYQMTQKNKVWKENEADVRSGVFLLARCHAKLSDASSSVFYLNGYLLEPKKYKKELQQSLKHKDFGWIHTTKEYVEYRKSAQRKLVNQN